MTTKQALKCIKEDFKVIEGSWQAQAITRLEDVTNTITKIVSNYNTSSIYEDDIKDLTFNDIVEVFTRVNDDMSKIKAILQ